MHYPPPKVSQNCHGKAQNLRTKTKYLTAKPKTSRQKRKPHGKTENPHGKIKDFRAKTKYLTAKPKLFCFCCEVFGFAVRYLVLAYQRKVETML